VIDGNNSLPHLPEGWIWTSLGELAALNPKFVDDVPDELEVSFIPMRCVEELTGQVDLSLTKRYSEVKKGYTAFRNGDVIFAKITPCMENGKVSIVNRLKNGIGFGSTEFHVIRLFNGQMPNRLMFFFLVRESFRRNARMHMTGSAGQLRVPKGYLEEVSFPLSPLPEQHRIAAKIEELFTKLDAGMEALKKIKLQLKQYRQAVLKYAFEGKLTEEWRKSHRGEIEPASVLLERIREEREGSSDSRFKEPPPVDTPNLPELPELWLSVRLGEIAQTVEKVSPKMAPDEEFTYIDIASIGGQSIAAPKKYLGKEAPSRARQLIKSGDILFSTVRTYLKHIALVEERYDGQIASTGFCVIRPFPYIESKLIFYLVQADAFLNPLTQVQRGTSYPAVRDSDVLAQPLALPPLPEQHQIMSEIERCFSIADAIEKDVEQSLRQAERLRQSILKRAFEGKLVPQEPTDEPAEELLKRIRAERARIEAEKKATGKTRRS